MVTQVSGYKSPVTEVWLQKYSCSYISTTYDICDRKLKSVTLHKCHKLQKYHV